VTTTTVFGFAAVTADISELLALDRSMLDRSEPSDSLLLTNTIATLEAAASEAAEWAELPILVENWFWQDFRDAVTLRH